MDGKCRAFSARIASKTWAVFMISSGASHAEDQQVVEQPMATDVHRWPKVAEIRSHGANGRLVTSHAIAHLPKSRHEGLAGA